MYFLIVYYKIKIKVIIVVDYRKEKCVINVKLFLEDFYLKILMRSDLFFSYFKIGDYIMFGWY